MAGSWFLFVVATGELTTGVVTTVYDTVDAAATATGIEKKRLLGHQSGNMYPLLLKANFSGYHSPTD